MRHEFYRLVAIERALGGRWILAPRRNNLLSHIEGCNSPSIPCQLGALPHPGSPAMARCRRKVVAAPDEVGIDLQPIHHSVAGVIRTVETCMSGHVRPRSLVKDDRRRLCLTQSPRTCTKIVLFSAQNCNQNLLVWRLRSAPHHQPAMSVSAIGASPSLELEN